jgi:hypothetical protein
VSRNLHLVFSHPGPGVSDAEFDAWYDEHLDEILSIPGFHTAQRYRLDPAVEDPQTPIPYRNIAVYEVDDDPVALMAAMEEAQLVSADSYADRKDAGDDGPQLPSWWSQVRFASFNAVPVGERHGA